MKSCLTCALFNPRTTVLSTTKWPGSGFFLHPLLFSVALFSLQLQPRSASFQFDQLLLLLPLTHSLTHFNPSNATIHHLLKTSSLCSAAHHCRHQHHQEVSLPLSASSDYTLSLSVGPPNSPTTIQLYMDTGSDLVCFPCSPFECILCEGKETPSTSLSPPPPSPTDSHLIPYRTASCTTAHSNLASSDLCAISGCPLDAIETTTSCASHPCPHFYYAYGDDSLITRLRRNPLSVGPLRLPNFTFTCAHFVLAEPVGIAGFGCSGLLSLPSQLAAFSPFLATHFSYYLISHSFHPYCLLRPKRLIFDLSLLSASQTKPDSWFVYTPLLPNPKHPYLYSVALLTLFIGPTRILAWLDLSTID